MKIRSTKSGSIKKNTSTEGETIEQKFRRIVNNKEPIKDGAPLQYTERSQGVMAGFDVRTDRFEVALDGMNAVNKSKEAKRDAKAKMEIVKDVGDESAQGKTESN